MDHRNIQTFWGDTMEMRILLHLLSILRMWKNSILFRKGRGIDETGIKSVGKLQSRKASWRRWIKGHNEEKKSRHRGTQVSLTLMAEVLLNWIVLEVNYLLREWQRIAISVQWTLEEEWNPCCMLILFGVLAKYTPNGLILRYQKKKWGFNSPWFSVCHTRWRGWDLLSSSLCLWRKVEPIAFQIFLEAWQSKPWG